MMVIFDDVAKVVPEEWKRSTYGVRMEYPVGEWVGLLAYCAKFRTTQENYDFCLSEIKALCNRFSITTDDQLLRIAFYKSS